jgi:hypothetical protein
MTFTIQAGKYYRTRDGRKVGPMHKLKYPRAGKFNWVDLRDHAWSEDGGFDLYSRQSPADLIAEWQGDTPAHIIQSSNGRVYDLTALEAPFGLLPEDVQNALKDWPHGCEIWRYHGWSDINPSWSTGCVYRAKPAPKVKEYVLYWHKDGNAKFKQWAEDTHRITIRDDGTGKLDITGEKLK